MILQRDPHAAVERIAASSAPRMFARRGQGTIVCRDCGVNVRREASHLECDCRTGFAAQWDQSLGGGFYLGRILAPDTEEVAS